MACGPNVNEKVNQFISRPTMFGYDVLYDSFNPPRIVELTSFTGYLFRLIKIKPVRG